MKKTGYFEPRTTISTSISNKAWNLAKTENISWSKALEFGIEFLSADEVGLDYPKCNLDDKCKRLALLISELNQGEEDGKQTKENTL